MRNFPGTHRLTAASAVLLAIAIAWLFCAGPVGADEKFHLSMGYMGSAYQEMTNNEIRAAVSLLIKKIAWKNFGKSEANYFETIADMAKEMKAGTVQVACLPPEQFLELRKLVQLEPLLVTTTTSNETELLLLVRKDSGIRSLKELKNRSLVISQLNNKHNSMLRVWIETLLLRQGEQNITTFFSSIKETTTTSRVVLPVFFRQADACVVTRQFFDLTAELNPQIAKELTVIASIQHLSQGIISVDMRLPGKIKVDVKEAFMALNDSPDGRQLLMLYQVSSFAPYRPGYLKATEALYAEHQRLLKRLGR